MPKIVRHDNLSAATHELKLSGGRALNKRFKAVLDHYDLRSSRITPHEANENGVAEQANHRVKSAIAQALVVRGSLDFSSVEDHVAFAEEVVERSRNRRAQGKLAEEKEHLKPLPSAPIPSYTTFHPKVRRWSTIQVAKRIYSVPSRLIGHTVEVHQHPDHLEVFYRGRLVERMPRLRGEKDHRIDYRHVMCLILTHLGLPSGPPALSPAQLELCVAGLCEAACANGLTYCFDKCVDTQDNRFNCGGCGQTCTATQTCDTGACVCVGKLTMCFGLCTNLNGNDNNCGACGVKCAANEDCAGGTCVVVPDQGVPDMGVEPGRWRPGPRPARRTAARASWRPPRACRA